MNGQAQRRWYRNQPKAVQKKLDKFDRDARQATKQELKKLDS